MTSITAKIIILPDDGEHKDTRVIATIDDEKPLAYLEDLAQAFEDTIARLLPEGVVHYVDTPINEAQVVQIVVQMSYSRVLELLTAGTKKKQVKDTVVRTDTTITRSVTCISVFAAKKECNANYDLVSALDEYKAK
jgi:hypothetical protein